jgi:two-component system nitrogen regulation response regulator NtrX
VWTDDALQLLSRHRWPGNVRELANIVERLAILHAGQVVTAEQVREVLPMEREGAPTRAPLPDPAALDRPLAETLDEFERAVIVRALSSAGGNVAEAARRLKTDRPNLYRRMKRLGVAEGGGGSHGAGGAGSAAGGTRNA